MVGAMVSSYRRIAEQRVRGSCERDDAPAADAHGLGDRTRSTDQHAADDGERDHGEHEVVS